MGVDLTAPEMVLMAEFSLTSILFTWALLAKTGVQYSATEYVNANVEILSVWASAPHDELANFWIKLFLVFILAAVFVRCSLYVSVLSKVTPR